MQAVLAAQPAVLEAGVLLSTLRTRTASLSGTRPHLDAGYCPKLQALSEGLLICLPGQIPTARLSFRFVFFSMSSSVQ